MKYEYQKIWKKNATFLPLFFSIVNHRGIMIDVSEDIILGNKITKVHRPYARRHIYRKEVQHKYIEKLEKQINYNNILQQNARDKV